MGFFRRQSFSVPIDNLFVYILVIVFIIAVICVIIICVFIITLIIVHHICASVSSWKHTIRGSKILVRWLITLVGEMVILSLNHTCSCIWCLMVFIWCKKISGVNWVLLHLVWTLFSRSIRSCHNLVSLDIELAHLVYDFSLGNLNTRRILLLLSI